MHLWDSEGWSDMKKIMICILVLICAVLFCAEPEKKKISVELVNRPVYELFEALKKDASFSIVYSKEQLTRNGAPVTINIDLTDTEAGLVLDVASRAAGFTFEKIGPIYAILPVYPTGTSVETVPAAAASVSDRAMKSNYLSRVCLHRDPAQESNQLHYLKNTCHG